MSKLNEEILTSIANLLQEDIKHYQHFVETGTYVGETTLNLQPHFKKLTTIELSLDLFLHFNKIKHESNFQNVYNYLGDSTILLPGILMVEEPDNIIFWLDGHYSGQTWAGETALGAKECPLLEECESIDKFCKSKKCIVLIDDFSLFEKKEAFDWSDISFAQICERFKNYNIKGTQTFKELQTSLSWSGDIFALALEK